MGKRVNTDRKCTVQGCDRIHRARGYCDFHWQRWRNGRELTLPMRYTTVFKKGWIMHGYRWLSTPNGEVMEHRYKMENHLKRKLTTDEVVHHKNRDKLDNRLENLEVLPRDKHTSLHRAHRSVCLICKVDDPHGSYGLCALHYMRTVSFLKRFDISIPYSKLARALLFMGIAQAMDTPGITQRLEKLYDIPTETE
jgi:hypothetical protein